MQPSSSFCRQQQEYHRLRSTSALLENVRAMSRRAELAWAQEGREAELRETWTARADASAADLAAETHDRCEWDEVDFSDNPDRGFASS
jgi:hypothetical protein